MKFSLWTQRQESISILFCLLLSLCFFWRNFIEFHIFHFPQSGIRMKSRFGSNQRIFCIPVSMQCSDQCKKENEFIPMMRKYVSQIKDVSGSGSQHSPTRKINGAREKISMRIEDEGSAPLPDDTHTPAAH